MRAKTSRRSRTRLNSRGRVLLLCLANLTVGLALWSAGVLRIADGLDRPLRLPLWVAVAVGALAELYVVSVQFRRDTTEFAASDIALVLLLFLAAPLDAAIGLIVGQVAGRALHLLRERRLEWVKVLFEVAVTVPEATLALLLFHGLASRGDPMGIAGWSAAFAAAAATNLYRTVMVELVMRATGASLPPRRWRHVAFGLGITGTFTGVGLLAVTLIWFMPTSLWLLLVPLVAVAVGYRAYTALLPRQERLEFLYETARLLQHTDGADDLLHKVLTRACDIFRAETAEVVLLPRTGQAQSLRARVTTGGAFSPLEPVATEPDPWWAPAMAGENGLLFSARSAAATTAEPAAVVTAPGIRNAMAVPFGGDSAVTGVLLVVNRLGGASRFDEEELRLLETLANHLGVALDNARLVADLQASLERIHYQAMHDTLTGLPNRAMLQERAAAAVSGGRDGGRRPAVLLIDLDGFKKVNDSLGHAAGDRLLTIIATRIRESIRPDDVPARLGGDEFAVLLPDVREPAEAVAVAERLLAALSGPVALGGHQVRPGGSIGLALWDGQRDLEELLGDADAAMYVAKAAGKGRMALFEPGMRQAALDRLAIESGLHQAVDRDELEVHYQPVVAVNTGRVVGLEAVSRWRRPGHGLVDPIDLLPEVDDSGLVVAIGTRVLQRACDQLSAWQRELGARAPVTVGVNLSPRHLEDPDLPAMVGGALGRAGLAAQHLELELTEGSLLDGGAQVDANLRALRRLGVRLTVDNFGTGHALIGYLRRFPVTGLKIDHSFTAALIAEPKEAALARAVIRLGQALELPTVADGVVTDAQLEVLKELRCTFAQGPLFSEPLPVAEMTAFLEGHPEGRPPSGGPTDPTTPQPRATSAHRP